MGNEATVGEVLDFWFGPLDAAGEATAEKRARWWKKSDAFDEEIRRRFGAIHASVHAGEREAWCETARGRLAYVIVLDQFSRNMFRGTPASFASDARALAAAKEGVLRGHDRELAGAERPFLYMPYMHAEDLAAQDECVALFRAIAEDAGGDESNLKFAIAHRDIVARFGRFPHRNAILGRASTAEEAEFLTQPGSSF